MTTILQQPRTFSTLAAQAFGISEAEARSLFNEQASVSNAGTLYVDLGVVTIDQELRPVQDTVYRCVLGANVTFRIFDGEPPPPSGVNLLRFQIRQAADLSTNGGVPWSYGYNAYQISHPDHDINDFGQEIFENEVNVDALEWAGDRWLAYTVTHGQTQHV